MTAWKPTATIQVVQQRALLLSLVREFFKHYQIMEVDTPMLSHATVTDPLLRAFGVAVDDEKSHQETRRFYLQTSPESAMKRLLAAGSGDIYQITKAFRCGENGRYHNPEFQILEWYRVGFDVSQLMMEVEALICHLARNFDSNIGSSQMTKEAYFKRISFQGLFQEYLGLDPLAASLDQLIALAVSRLNVTRTLLRYRQQWLDLLFSHLIQPDLGFNVPVFVTHLPVELGGWAKQSNCDDQQNVLDRFELFINGMEIANGCQELTDVVVLKQRMQQEVQMRQTLYGTADAQQKLDANMIAAIESGMPECSGVAIGLDRLLMVFGNLSHIDQALAFPWTRA